MRKHEGAEKFHPSLLWRNRRFTGMLLGNFLTIAAVFSLLLLTVILLAYHFSARSISAQLSENNLTALQESVSQMEQNILRARGTLLVIAQNQDVDYFLRQDKSLFSDYEQNTQVERVRQMINGYIAGDAFLDSIMVYNRKSGQMINDSGLVTAADTDIPGENTSKDTGWLPLIDELLSRGQLPPIPRRNQFKTPVLTILQSTPLLLREWKGMVSANLNSVRLFSAVGGQFVYAVTDASGRIIGASDQSLIDQPLTALLLPESVHQSPGSHIISRPGGQALVSVCRSVYGWWFYLTDNMETYNARMDTFNRVMLILAGAGLILCALFAYVVSLRMFLPIRGLMRTLRERGNELALPLEDRKETGNEIAFLSETILHSLDRSKELNASLNERLKKITAVRLQMLRSQISPHFLYNTLASINWMVLEKLPDDNDISEALCLLSDLLRAALKSPTLVPLSQELKQAERYLSLQKLCLKSNVEWEMKIDPSAQDAMTPSMLLQPLAENAVKHGLSPEEEGRTLHILIFVCREGDSLRLTIRDDGQEVPPEKIQELTEKLSSGAESSIGLSNVYQKLQLIFETKSLLTLRGVKPRGFEVEIVHPYVKISDHLEESEPLKAK